MPRDSLDGHASAASRKDSAPKASRRTAPARPIDTDKLGPQIDFDRLQTELGRFRIPLTRFAAVAGVDPKRLREQLRHTSPKPPSLATRYRISAAVREFGLSDSVILKPGEDDTGTIFDRLASAFSEQSPPDNDDHL